MKQKYFLRNQETQVVSCTHAFCEYFYPPFCGGFPLLIFQNPLEHCTNIRTRRDLLATKAIRLPYIEKKESYNTSCVEALSLTISYEQQHIPRSRKQQRALPLLKTKMLVLRYQSRISFSFRFQLHRSQSYLLIFT